MIEGEFAAIKERRFFHIPPNEHFYECGIPLSVREYLEENSLT